MIPVTGTTRIVYYSIITAVGLLLVYAAIRQHVLLVQACAFTLLALSIFGWLFRALPRRGTVAVRTTADKPPLWARAIRVIVLAVAFVVNRRLPLRFGGPLTMSAFVFVALWGKKRDWRSAVTVALVLLLGGFAWAPSTLLWAVFRLLERSRSS